MSSRPLSSRRLISAVEVERERLPPGADLLALQVDDGVVLGGDEVDLVLGQHHRQQAVLGALPRKMSANDLAMITLKP